jgi:hypothetical protein
MKKAKRFGSIGILFVILFVVGAACNGRACGQDYAYDHVSIIIKEEYRRKYEDGEFTLADLNYENAERLDYVTLSGEPESGLHTMFIHVYLKKKGKERVNEAVDYFVTLEFVLRAHLLSYRYR